MTATEGQTASCALFLHSSEMKFNRVNPKKDKKKGVYKARKIRTCLNKNANDKQWAL